MRVRRGFLFLEILIVLALIAVGFALVCGSLQQIARWQAVARMRMDAVNYASTVFDYIKKDCDYKSIQNDRFSVRVEKKKASTGQWKNLFSSIELNRFVDCFDIVSIIVEWDDGYNKNQSLTLISGVGHEK